MEGVPPREHLLGPNLKENIQRLKALAWIGRDIRQLNKKLAAHPKKGGKVTKKATL